LWVPCRQKYLAYELTIDPGIFRFILTFAEQSNGKTVLMMRQLAATTEQRDGMIGFGAVEYGYQTQDKLAAYVGF